MKNLSFLVYDAVWVGVDTSSTRPPFVTLLSRRVQSGRCSSFGKRVWFTESYIVIVFSRMFYLFILFLIYVGVKLGR